MGFKNKVKSILKKMHIGIQRVDDKSFYTYWKRPKYASDIYSNGNKYYGKDVGIIIQGIICYKDDFTLETVRLYKKLFPASTIVVSTWNTENMDYLKRIEAEGVAVVISELPEKIIGIQFINLQRQTTKSGIEKAIEMSGCKYILKTRTDERIYSYNAMNFFINILHLYPLRTKAKARGRIISTSLCSFMDTRFYNVSDLCVFGYAEDVLRYFSPPIDNRKHGDVIEGNDPAEYSKQRPGEMYFATHYVEAIGHELEWTREDSEYCFKEYFVIIDSESIDLYWPKYMDSEYPWRDYKGMRLHRMTYSNWLGLWSGDEF